MMHPAINCIGVFIAAIVSGATGLAFPLIATPIFLIDYAPPQAILITSLCSLSGQLLSIRLLRQTITYEIRWPLIFAGLFGVPFGTFALLWWDGRIIRLGLGVLLAICGAWRLALVGWRAGPLSRLLFGARHRSLWRALWRNVWCLVRASVDLARHVRAR